MLEAGRHGEGFRGNVGGEAPAGQRGDRKAHALHADRIADGDVGQLERAAFHLERPQPHDRADRLHDSRELGAGGYRKAPL